MQQRATSLGAARGTPLPSYSEIPSWPSFSNSEGHFVGSWPEWILGRSCWRKPRRRSYKSNHDIQQHQCWSHSICPSSCGLSGYKANRSRFPLIPLGRGKHPQARKAGCWTQTWCCRNPQCQTGSWESSNRPGDQGGKNGFPELHRRIIQQVSGMDKQMLPTLVGLRHLRAVTFSSEGFPGEHQDLWGRGHSEPTWPAPISLMANKVQRFSQSLSNTCPGTELLLEHSELLFFSFSLLFSVFCNIAREEPWRKGGRWRENDASKWLAQVYEENLKVRLETVWMPVSISVWLCRAIHLPPLTPAWSKVSAPLTHLPCNNLETSKSESRS